MPKKKDRFMTFGVTGIDPEKIPPEEKEEVKICFRAPKILRTKVKEFVLKNSYGSENRVYEEATWKFITNYNYAEQVKQSIERSTKYIFEQMRKEYGTDYKKVQETFQELVGQLRRITDPLITAHKELKQDLENTLEKGRYQIQTWILYFVGVHGKLTRDELLRLVLDTISYPSWLVDDALALLVQNGLLHEAPQGIFSLRALRK